MKSDRMSVFMNDYISGLFSEKIGKSGQAEHLIPDYFEHMIPDATEYLNPGRKHHNIKTKG
jgi:hypothetical protein